MWTKIRRVLALLGAKTLASTVIAALAVGAIAWNVLPVMPRMTVPSKSHVALVTWSSDCQFVAFANIENSTPRSINGELAVWDTHAARHLFSIPYNQTFPPEADGGYSFAFTPDADKLVLYSWGDAKFHLLPTGKEWQPDRKTKFPVNGRSRVGRLVTGIDEKLYVLIHDTNAKTTEVHDVITGREVNSWTDSPHAPQILQGGTVGSILEMCKEGRQLREIPSGKIHHVVPSKDDARGSIIIESHAVTPDCQTLVVADGKIRKHTQGKETRYNLPATDIVTISPDGNIVGTIVLEPHGDGMLSRYLRHLRISKSGSFFVFYDLTTSKEVVRMPEVTQAHFSRDGKTVISIMPNAVELYDWPPTSPWQWIAVFALVGASGVFLLGQWIRWRNRKRSVVVKPV